MKRYTFLLSLILLSGLVSATPLDVIFIKDNYFVGETIQGEIFLDDIISSISPGIMSLQKADSDVYFSPYLINLGSSHYFFYFGSTNLEGGDYHLIFNNIIYSLNGTTQQNDFNFSMGLNESNHSIISFSPGFLDARYGSMFDIYVKNEGLIPIDISLSSDAQFIESSEQNIHLDFEESKLVTIYVSGLMSQETTG